MRQGSRSLVQIRLDVPQLFLADHVRDARVGLNNALSDIAQAIAQSLTSFVFSPRNVHGPGTYGVSAEIVIIDSRNCPDPQAELASFFLA